MVTNPLKPKMEPMMAPHEDHQDAEMDHVDAQAAPGVFLGKR